MGINIFYQVSNIIEVVFMGLVFVEWGIFEKYIFQFQEAIIEENEKLNGK